MAKRFTDTNKYKNPFIRGLQGAYKVLWDYLYHDCDHAGIWIVDFEIAQIYVGSDLPIDKGTALKEFNKSQKRIIELDYGKKWFIPGFISFQYGVLNPGNRAHKSVIDILLKHNIEIDDKGLIRPLEGCKDMVKDKVKDKESKPLKIRKTNKTLSAHLVKLEPDFPFLSDIKFFNLFLDHCLEKSTTVTERAIRMRLEALVPFGLDWSKKRLKTAISSGWKGLVFDDDKPALDPNELKSEPDRMF